MFNSPRLRDLFGGVAVTDLSAADLAAAVAGRVAEMEELDWKKSPYEGPKKGKEIAKDIAAFANRAGGIIVLGVDEDPATAEAKELTPFPTSPESVELMMRSACADNIYPRVADLDFRKIAADDTDASAGWFLVVAVGKSRDAPHAVAPSSEHTLLYPIRDGQRTHYLREPEVAARYRDRFASRGDLIAQTAVVHAEGLEQLDYDSEEAWITISCVPSTQGNRGRGAQARSQEASFLEGWLRHRLPGQWFVNVYRERSHAARGRTVFSDRPVRSAPSRFMHAELLHNGGGFAAQVVSAEPWQHVNYSDDKYTRSAINWIATDRIEWAVFTTLRFLADHAIDTGAGGELEIVAQLELHGNPFGLCVPNPGAPNSNGFTHHAPDGKLALSTTTTTTATASLTSDPDRSIAAAAFELTADILAEFGVDEPRLFTADGSPVEDVAVYVGPALTTAGAMNWLEARRESQTPPPDTDGS